MNPRYVCAICSCAIAWISISLAYSAEGCEPSVARVISVQGKVEVNRTGRARWQRVRLEESLCAGDRVRIEARSRAAILLANQTVLRLDEGSTIVLSEVEPDKTSLLEILKGVLHFISRVPRTLEIKTPFVNAAIEGTEFVVRVGDSQTELLVFEGSVRVSNSAGSLLLTNDQAAVAEAGKAPVRRIIVKPRKTVQWALYYPPIIDYRRFDALTSPDARLLKQSIAMYRRNDISEALAKLDSVPVKSKDTDYYTLRAGILLSVGRINEANADIERIQSLHPDNGVAYALKSIVAVAQNEDESALHLAQKAVDSSPQSPVPYIALSYAHQALFDLDKALTSVQKAVEITPGDALAWARIAELLLSMGEMDNALAASRKAAALDPYIARTQTVMGYANLMRIDVEEAQQAFKKAIELDSAAPLPRLGLGLAKIRDGDLDDGTEQIEIAASLDPDNALIRSYLGKAYFEQKRDKLAAAEYATAKSLDPNDPTPYFYDAIRKQTENRPVEALQDLQKAIELNDARAVYRSRLLLDQDLAARSASLARIYDDLGFGQRALVEGWKSLDADPSDYSAHRLLSDSYAGRPRHEIARVSELLQSQLLQPLNINALQPQLAETSLQILEGTGPSALSFNEFNPLFMRDRLALQFSGVAGNQDTWGNDLVVSGLKGPLSISAGQFHYETNGFRENNDLQHDIYNVFVQGAVSPRLNLQSEYRKRKTKRGDIELRFDPQDFSTGDHEQVDRESIRFGGRYSFSPRSDLLASGIYADRSETEDVSGVPAIHGQSETDGYQVEIQHLLRHERFNTIVGGGRYDVDALTRVQLNFPAPLPSVLQVLDLDTTHNNAYLYSHFYSPWRVTWTLGVSYDDYKQKNAELEVDKFNPKFGIQWDVTERIRMRAAYVEAVKRALVLDQTIEPTQVAGFNQLYDDPNGTEMERYGLGLDTVLSANLYGGVEVSRRDLVVPGILSGESVRLDRREDLYRAYLYWAPSRSWAFSLEADFERFKRSASDPSVVFGGDPSNVDTLSAPFFLRYFHPKGLFASLGGTFVHQELDLSPSSDLTKNSDEFFVLDASIGYRLPRRWGLISLEGRNLLDEEFFFQDLDTQTATGNVSPRFIPDRTFLLRATFAFN